MLYHTAPYYQRETAYRIFTRAMFDRDIATGKTKISKQRKYKTRGPASSFHIKHVLPEPLQPICYVWAFTTTCTKEQITWMKQGTAIVKDFVVVGHTNQKSI
jgi:hypothetical protein